MRKVKFEDLKHEEQILVKMAEETRENSYSPGSKYKIGAALLADNGKFYSGCNVEARGCPTNHAEVTAIDTMVADGGRKIMTICCVSDITGIPCASCRQKIWFFSKGNSQLKIISIGNDKNIYITTIGELYPYPYPSSESLKD